MIRVNGVHLRERECISIIGCCYIYEAHSECHDILMVGKSPIKWRQRRDKTIDWGKKTNKKHGPGLLLCDIQKLQA